MAYDQALAARVRKSLKGKRNFTEREQFGGVGFLLKGNVACGVIKDALLVRVGPQKHEDAMGLPGAGVFSLTGKPSKGWILVDAAALKSDASLNQWIELALAFVKGLPPK